MGYLSLVKQLLDRGASMNKQDASGNTALHYAAAYGKKDVLRYLLSNGALTDVSNVLEQKPIDYSNMQGFNEITALLIDFGAKTNAIDEEHLITRQKVFSEPKQGMDMGLKKQALFDLKELMDAGIINQEEFDLEKAKILKA
ncbi:Ankyrin repeat protein [compost metagenome]